MNVEKINRRAARGAKLLDEKRPGWHRVIDLGILDIQDLCNCVLGQQDGYHDMIHEFFGGADDLYKQVVRHGFDISEKAYDKENVNERFHTLSAAWRREITERLNADQN